MSLRVLVVDDEALARSRLRTLLAGCGAPHAEVAAEAATVAEAQAALREGGIDAILLDIHMPGASGLDFARSLRSMAQPPAVVFVTAHAEHAVTAFELEAVDYLTKPVRQDRLQAALQKVARRAGAAPAAAGGDALLIQDRGRAERVPLAEVLYLKAELKYVTVRTAAKSYILDASLSELEERHAAHFVRVHRNALVARQAIRALERHVDAVEGEGWGLRLHGIDEVLAVSRRQLAAVKEAMGRHV